MGKLIKQKTFTNGTSVNLSGLPGGVYIFVDPDK